GCGRGRLPESWAAFYSDAVKRFATLENQFAKSVDELELPNVAALGRWLQTNFGLYGRYAAALLKIAERCALARRAGDPRTGLPDLDALITLAAEIGDVPLESMLTMERGLADEAAGDTPSARAWFERAAALAAQVGNRAELADAAFNVGQLLA